jgi:RNA 3'-phosphate cyclase
MDIIDIDGSLGEGGGQILRIATGLSAVTSRPVRITNIRSNRKVPGLKPQHLKGVEAVARLCNAQLTGFSEGSTQLEFHPGELDHDHLKLDVGTAGSIGLVFQSIMIPAIRTDMPLEFEVTGGTDVAWSPTVTYFKEVFCNTIKRMGIQADVSIMKHGFYPKGGGQAILSIHPGSLRRIDLTEREKLIRYDVISVASEDLRKAEVAERQARAAAEILGRRTEIESKEYVASDSPGSSLHAHAHYGNTTLGETVLGSRGKPSEQVGRECAEALMRQVETGACLDRWIGDQILPFMALAPGRSEVSVSEVSDHARTSMGIIERFLPVRFSVKEESGHFIVTSEQQ